MKRSAVVLVALGLALVGCTPEPEIVEKTVEVEVEVTPESCLDALAISNQMQEKMQSIALTSAEFDGLIDSAAEAGWYRDQVLASQIGSERARLVSELEAGVADYNSLAETYYVNHKECVG